jgi:hypothetical protein
MTKPVTKVDDLCAAGRLDERPRREIGEHTLCDGGRLADEVDDPQSSSSACTCHVPRRPHLPGRTLDTAVLIGGFAILCGRRAEPLITSTTSHARAPTLRWRA